MAGRQDIQAGGAFIRLFLKDDLTKALSSALSGVAASVAGISTAVAGGVAAAVTQFVHVGSELNDMSARTGASAKQLQEWTFAAQQSGASAEDLERALKGMVKNGLSIADFERVGRDIAAIQDPSERAAAALDTFGKSGMRLLPMLSEFNSLKAAANSLGPMLTEEDVRMADALGDAFGALMESVKRLTMQIGVALGPQLKGILDTAIGMVASLSDAIKNANTFGSGGDLLDQLATWERTPFADFAKRGAAATATFSAIRTGGGVDEEDARAAALGRQADITKTILDAENRRRRLIDEFATPLERFLAKEKEILNALAEVNRNRVLNFISPEQAAAEKKALDVALGRARAAEMERRAKLLGKPAVPVEVKDIKEIAPQFATTSATSTFGALSLAQGGGGQNRVISELVKGRALSTKMLQALQGIERNAHINAIFSR